MSQGVMYSTGNIVNNNNFVWFMIYKNIESLCCICETNVILYVNYTSSRKNKKERKEMQRCKEKNLQA